MSTILVTGGAGYIGSHTVLLLIEAGYEVVVVDNLSNSSQVSLQRVAKLTGKEVKFHRADIQDKAALEAVFAQYSVEAVIHFAGLKAVGESNQIPLAYYQNNVAGSVTLLEVMQSAGCRHLVFSSSATVYGDPASVPITETFPTSATNPYGRTKLMIEEILADLYESDSDWNIARLRYFNPVGAHPSGLIGEDPNGIPNNLVPFISQVAVGKLERLSVFGDDYPTPDGTGVRDYIHVMDLAAGHLKALEKLNTKPGLVTYNLGTGTGYSVLEMARSFAKVNGVGVPLAVGPRRAGDIAECWANASKAKEELNWQAKLGLDDMLRDTWNWQKNNPNGFEK
jgi:UDP-glucose 4-epimerase